MNVPGPRYEYRAKWYLIMRTGIQHKRNDIKFCFEFENGHLSLQHGPVALKLCENTFQTIPDIHFSIYPKDNSVPPETSGKHVSDDS